MPKLPPKPPSSPPPRPFTPLPAAAAWRHLDARVGFEVVYAEPYGDGQRIEGRTTAMEDGEIWAVGYTIELDASRVTREARITGRSLAGTRETTLTADGAGRWLVDGAHAAHLDGCLDVDLEASAFTNALPVRRLALDIGTPTSAPAAYVRAVGLGVERLEQEYTRVEDDADGRQRYDYASPAFDFACRLVYDASGLVLDYPGIAVRVG
ncbi:putative glycolipid-binding domain-containing protein [Streptomyces sp. NPDC058001]|uniref:putative glycolipid-binding domain-containing protein n=1 Tax=Streptomyces sp. NPDC058001 TaxID=3346300 RepID=UPI0036E906C2